MREHPGEGSARESNGDAEIGPAEVAPVNPCALRLTSHITAAEAVAVFQRKLPGAAAEAVSVFHPFWWTALSAQTRGIFSRSGPVARTDGRKAVHADRSDQSEHAGPGQSGPGQRMNVLVNAYSGKGYIADFEPQGDEVAPADWQSALESSDQAGPAPSPFEVSRTARSLVRTKVLKTVKLGMSITLDEVVPPRGILKPNWLVTGANEKFAATILVDGLDSSHYIVRVEKL
ncbi:MAG: hypothetical protein L0G69_05290 [Brevibacterium sp.]|nr:hypothetical protein [Brevibacterium sp.]